MAGKFRDKFAITGVGLTPTARVPAPGMSGRSLEAWAAKLAIEDAGLRRENIDAAIQSFGGNPNPMSVWGDTFSRVLGLRPKFTVGMGRPRVFGSPVVLACHLLERGMANYVLIAMGLNSWSATHSPDRTERGMVGFPREVQLPRSYGLEQLGYYAAATAAWCHAFFMSRHMYEYGTTHEQLGAVAIAARQWACLTPEARMYGIPLTMEDYLSSRWVMYPYRLADCSLQSDFGGAMIVTTAERARDLKKRPVYIMGLGLGDAQREVLWDNTNYTQTPVIHGKAAALLQAGICIRDLDIVELFSCFTGEVIIYLEDYGFCKKGEGGPFVESGAIAPGGSLPVNTNGGLLSYGHMADWTELVEAVTQLRGEAGPRQVKDAEIALANIHGGESFFPYMSPTHATVILRR